MHQVEGILHNSYSFFVHIPKKLTKFQKLVDLFNTKGNKLFKNVKTRWINHFSKKKKCIEYHQLIIKIHVETWNYEK